MADMDLQKAPANDVRVVILGDTGAGKTHLLRRLLADGKPVPDPDSSRETGVGISEKIYQIGTGETRVRFWDFGEQELRHSMYRMFLTDRTIYAVVVNADDSYIDTPAEQVRYWLQELRHFMKNSRVLVILNQVDWNPLTSTHPWYLHDTFPELKRVISISALKSSETAFQDMMIRPLLEEIGHLQDSCPGLPGPWRRVLDALPMSERSHLDETSFDRLCAEYGITDRQEINDMLDRFQELGVAFCYRGFQRRSYVVLDPEWITKALHAVSADHAEAETGGFGDIEDVFRVLCRTPQYCSADEADYIVSIAQKFELFFVLDHGLTFMPVYARPHQPPLAKEYAYDQSVLEYRQSFSHLPDTVIYHLMEALGAELDWKNSWRSGARFVRGAASAVVRTHDEDLRIFVRSESPEDPAHAYLQHILDALGGILKTLNLESYNDYVIYREGLLSESFSYKTLSKAAARKSKWLYSQILKKPIAIEDILKQNVHQDDAVLGKLLTDISKGCLFLQRQRRLADATVDLRNDALRDYLWSKGHLIVHPSLAGMTRDTVRRGEVDLLIMDEKRKPLAILEALRVKSAAQNQLRYWNQHLTKLLYGYNTAGLSNLFLLSYVECDRTKFQPYWREYCEHMRRFQPERCQLRDRTFEELSTESPLLRVARCSYDCGSVTSTVYHCFVWMGSRSSQTDERRTPEAIPQSKFYQESIGQNRPLCYPLDADEIDPTTLSLLVSQKSPYLVRVGWSESNSVKTLRYYTAPKVPLSSLLRSGVSKKLLCRILRDIMGALQFTDEYPLDPNAIILHPDYIFTDVSTNETQLICLPVEAVTSAAVDTTEFLLDLLGSLCFDDSVQGHELKALAHHLRSSSVFLPERFLEYLTTWSSDAPQLPPPAPVPVEETAAPEDLPRAPEPAREDSQTPPPSTEFRVVLLGDSEAGKSLILARLKQPDMDPASFSGDTTPGIDIASICYTIAERQVRVNFWDFGGQEVLHSMHRLFMAEQTLYLIVLNTRNDNQDAQADFWLRYVQTYAPGAPMLLVMNKIDQNPRAALNRPALERRFPEPFCVPDVLAISARDWTAEEFRTGFTDVLLSHIADSLSDGNCFTPRELRIRDHLYQEKDAVHAIDPDDFCAHCAAEGLTDPEEQRELMRRFHAAGILVFFGELVEMLLEPKWLTEAIYKILEKGDELASNGVIADDDVVLLYRTDPSREYKGSHARFVLPIMRSYGLSFPYEQKVRDNPKSRDAEFIPMLCRREEPPEIRQFLEEHEMTEMQLRFEYLPVAVLYQLMVERKNELDIGNTWRSGAMFHDGRDTHAIVRRDGNIMTLYVCSYAPRIAVEYLMNLVETIKRCASGRYCANLQETLMGFGIAGSTEYFDHDRLMKASACNVRYTFSKLARRSLAIQDILDQQDRSREQHLQELLRLTRVGCLDLQSDMTFWFREKEGQDAKAASPRMDENARNRQLRRRLEQSFFVSDQPQSGESGTGASPGELDIAVRIERDVPWSILEALIISGTDARSLGNWREHLLRLLNRYNKSGLRYLVLVSYLNSDPGEFLTIQKRYLTELSGTEVPALGGAPKECESVRFDDTFDRLHVSRAHYSGGSGDVTLYHFLVHIPKYSPEKKEKAPAAKKVAPRKKVPQ